jgi:hypothetical protein
MRVPNYLKIFCIGLMSFIMTNIPQLAMAEAQMITTSAVVADINRAQEEQNVQSVLQMTEVRHQLLKQGISPDEVSQRVASLSDTELKQLSGQMDQVRAGGDILFAILIVVLIIFLIKRL